MKYYNYKDLGANDGKLPFSTHLMWEVSTSLMFMVDSTNQKVLLKSVDKGLNFTTVTTRDHKIQSAWHDRTNGLIYLVDCDNDGTADDFDVWKITTDGNDTITSIGTSTGATADTVYALDIFMIGTDVFVLHAETQVGTPYYVISEVDTAPFSEEDKWSGVDFNGRGSMFGIVTGTKYYTFAHYQSIGGGFYNFLYDDSITTITFADDELDSYDISSNINLRGLSYDGSNLLYFIAEKDADSKNYLAVYSISEGIFTVLGEYNISLMLDRNTSSGVLEKAFHLTEPRVYQLHPYASHQLYYIAKIDTTGTIKGITDNFIIIET